MGQPVTGRGLLQRLEAIPEAIRSPFLLVLALQAGLFVAGPLPDVTRLGLILVPAAACFMLALAIHASHGGPWTKRSGWLAAIALFVLNRIAKSTDADALVIVHHVLVAALIAAAGFLVLRTLLQSKEVRAEQIYAGICFYLMLGLLWATAYAFLDWLDLAPAAFSRDIVTRGALGGFEQGQYGELLYFSYITLATVGYGDIVPTHPITRNLAAFEALSGQIYVAVLLARLVALQSSRPRGGAGNGGSGARG